MVHGLKADKTVILIPVMLIMLHWCGATCAQQTSDQNNPEEIIDAAEKAFTESRYQEAVKLYSKIPDNSGALTGRATAYECLQMPQKAADDYQKAIQLDPANYRAMENLAGLCERDGNYVKEALSLYKTALTLDPRAEWRENIHVWIAVLERRLRHETESAVAIWQRGNEKALEDKIEEAESLYTQSMEMNPNMFQAYFRRGIIRFNSGRYDEAEKDFSDTVKLSPGFRGAYVFKGLANEQLGRMKEAEKDFELAVKHDSHDPEANFHIARMFENSRDYESARTHYNEALLRRPSPELRRLVHQRLETCPGAKSKAVPEKPEPGKLW